MGGSTFVFDFQAFKTLENEYVLKEVALAGVDSNAVLHYLVKAPFSYEALDSVTKERVDYVKRNIHGLCWNSGFIELRHVRKALATALKDAVVVYIKGSERAQFLRGFLRDIRVRAAVVDLDNDADFMRVKSYTRRKWFDHDHGSYRHMCLRCSLEQATAHRDILRKTLYRCD